MFTLLGPAAKEVVSDWGGDALTSLPRHAHAVLNFGGAPVVAARDSGLGAAVDGWTFIVDEPAAADFWRKAALKARGSAEPPLCALLACCQCGPRQFAELMRIVSMDGCVRVQGALPMGTEAWDEVRILNGVPAAGAELTGAYNPLEAGLYHAVSLAKGCYVGQETIAKVHNNNGVPVNLATSSAFRATLE